MSFWLLIFGEYDSYLEGYFYELYQMYHKKERLHPEHLLKFICDYGNGSYELNLITLHQNR